MKIILLLLSVFFGLGALPTPPSLAVEEQRKQTKKEMLCLRHQAREEIIQEALKC